MAIYNLYEDLKYSNWRRVHYSIEANSLEEAKRLILDGEADCDYSEDLGCEEYLDPLFCQDEQPTHEIYDKDNDLDPIYTNGI